MTSELRERLRTEIDAEKRRRMTEARGRDLNQPPYNDEKAWAKLEMMSDASCSRVGKHDIGT